ncbi:EamA family transporter [Pseudomonas asuensis]|uniref:Membrane protein n=1 Tax=Pseudomonas asuensis TaxID=1825787 RepID=A0ABQ2H2D1_9PSED|nr:EamA family transporter [Pseudomonas asuensis]GGM28994.1 membrane protein [Pseudomonas asuensis]
MKARHLLLAVMITAIWGFNFSVIKLGLATVDPFILAGLRFLLCAVPAIFLIPKPAVPWRYLISYGLVFGVGLWGIVNLGIKIGLSAGLAALVLQVSAFFTIALGALVFSEPLRRHQIAGGLLALLGLALVMLITDGSVSLPGVMLVVCGAVCWSIANLIIKRADTREVLGFLVWSSAFAPIPLFMLSYILNGATGYALLIEQLNLTALLSLAFQVYPNTLLAYWIWNSLLRQYPLSTVAPLSLLVPVFGLLGSVLIFNETLPMIKLIAMVLVLLGLLAGLYGQAVLAWFIPVRQRSL